MTIVGQLYGRNRPSLMFTTVHHWMDDDPCVNPQSLLAWDVRLGLLVLDPEF